MIVLMHFKYFRYGNTLTVKIKYKTKSSDVDLIFIWRLSAILVQKLVSWRSVIVSFDFIFDIST